MENIDPQKIEHFPRSVNNFRTEHLGEYFSEFWSPNVAEDPQRNPKGFQKNALKGSKANHQSMQLDAHKNIKFAISKMYAKGGGQKFLKFPPRDPESTSHGCILLSVLNLLYFCLLDFGRVQQTSIQPPQTES